MSRAEPERVPTTRATVVRTQPFASAGEAASWLEGVQGDGGARQAEARDALRRVNGAIRAQRAAAGDPYLREVSLAQALVLRLGYGPGEGLAEGRFTQAWEAPPERRGTRRSMGAPQERFAALIGARDRAAVAEELVLRARLDLDAGQPRESALQARVALEALLAELGHRLPDEPRATLEADREAVAAAAAAALRTPLGESATSSVEAAVGHMESALRCLHVSR
ncbi:MAG: hypothetical protein M3433_05380 [Actinomycetota bacterium]|nr:hypothetical protein [Actinomycetota bacterium]